MQSLTLDGITLGEKAVLHPLLARELSFPSWYGGNLDALFDCLTDVTEEVTITLRELDDLTPYARRVVKVLQAAAKENPHIHLHTD